MSSRNMPARRKEKEQLLLRLNLALDEGGGKLQPILPTNGSSDRPLYSQKLSATVFDTR
jgi:hypothetical protein